MRSLSLLNSCRQLSTRRQHPENENAVPRSVASIAGVKIATCLATNRLGFDPHLQNGARSSTGPHVRCWLQAAIRRIVIYVGFTSSSGHLDAEFPLLEALRTEPGVPRPAANDPKRSSASEPRLAANSLNGSYGIGKMGPVLVNMRHSGIRQQARYAGKSASNPHRGRIYTKNPSKLWSDENGSSGSLVMLTFNGGFDPVLSKVTCLMFGAME